MCPEPTDPRDWHLLGLLVTIFLEVLTALSRTALARARLGLLVMMMLLALLRSLSALACARQVLLGRPLRAP